MSAHSSVQFLQWSGAVLGVVFFFALGAIVGSFINVVVYRLPRGINVVVPGSRCPACNTRLRFSQNFPVFGWLWLRGRCRYCRTPISPEYPLVEFVVGALFALLYAMWFADPQVLAAIGIDATALRPEWASEGVWRVWPMLAIVLTLVSSLVAMTLIDARTFTIPLSLPWIAAAAALLTHPLHAAWLDAAHSGLARSPHRWTIPVHGWVPTIAAIGACAGLAASSALLALRLLPRSFADYAEWESEAVAEEERARRQHPAASEPSDANALGPVLYRTLLFTGPAVALMLLGFSMGLRIDKPFEGMFLGLAIGLVVGMLLRRIAPRGGAEDDQPLWVQYPHARREMLKEVVFLAPAAALAGLGWVVGGRLTGDPPLWLAAAGGSMLGLVAGGGLVWAVRIVGSLAFGKEAMGLGDVHLMAAVGATLGWIDPSVAFFIAPFFGISAAVLSLVLSGVFKRAGTALPYGPSLALATLVVIYAKPLVETVLGLLFRAPVDLP